MFDRILVPVDFSEQSRSAFGHGALFARTFGGEIALCHVVEHVVQSHPPFWLGEPELARELDQQALLNAERSLAKLLPSLPVGPGISVTPRVLSGLLPTALVEYAEHWGAGLMVVSTHGRTGLSRWLMGSVSERLLRASPCPVLVARGGSGQVLPTIKRVLVAVDLSDLSRRALQVAAQVAAKFGGELDVSYVWAAPYYEENARTGPGLFERIREHARAELDDFVAQSGLDAGLSIQRTIVSGTPGAKIIDRAREYGADLLVLGTHGHGGFQRMMLGSVAEAAVRYAPCATLVVR
jgi:nucleotide-binding universal stress UspA family protein